MPVNIQFAGALAVAVTGLAAGLLTAGSHDNARMNIVSAGIPAPPVATPRALTDRLDEIHRLLVIRPDQKDAWQRYAGTLLQLNRESRHLLQRVANGEAQDDGTERVLHALTLAAAFGELEKNLSAGQIAQARLLTQDLADGLICRGLADNQAR